MNWLKQALTGRDNQTFAFARLIGFAVMIVFGFGLPMYAIITIRDNAMDVGEWLQIWSALPVYLSLIIGAVGMLIAGTAFTEPHAPPRDKPASSPDQP